MRDATAPGRVILILAPLFPESIPEAFSFIDFAGTANCMSGWRRLVPAVRDGRVSRERLGGLGDRDDPPKQRVLAIAAVGHLPDGVRHIQAVDCFTRAVSPKLPAAEFFRHVGSESGLE